MLLRSFVRLSEVCNVVRCEWTILRRPLWRTAPGSAYQPCYSSRTPLRLDSCRDASSSSSTRWKTRQVRDSYAREAKVAGLKSRAAFKLLEINDKYRLFRRGDTVVDLGYAPGSWSQVAVNRTQPGGRVIGIDIIPAQPPRGVSTIQGNFLSPVIRDEVRQYVQDPDRGRARTRGQLSRTGSTEEGLTEDELAEASKSLIEREKELDEDSAASDSTDADPGGRQSLTQKALDRADGKVVNVVLSDMSEPWPMATYIKSVSNPYRRMMNTSGMPFRDHAGSMDLCQAALTFCYDTLITNGHFLCKFYQGAEDHALELRLRKLFEKVHRIKPDSSRKESKESYFVCLRRRASASREEVLGEDE